MDKDTILFSVTPQSLADNQVRIIAFGKDANGEVQVHHLNLDNLAWMLAKHQEGKNIVIKEDGMYAVKKEIECGA